MPSVRIALPAGTSVATGPKCTLTSKGYTTLTLPITNPQVQMENLAPNWTQLERPGLILAPYTVKAPRKLHTLTLTATLVNISGVNESIEGLMQDLYAICNSNYPINVGAYGAFLIGGTNGMTAGGYVCTSLEIEPSVRDINNNTTQATATIELTEANMGPTSIGIHISSTPTRVNTPPTTSSGSSTGSPILPTGGGGYITDTAAVSPDAPNIQLAASYSSGSTPTTTAYGPLAAASQLPATVAAQTSYQVQGNDTIWSISNALYGTTAYGRQVAQANGIIDPRSLTPGQTLSVV